MRSWKGLLLIVLLVTLTIFPACGASEAEMQRKQALDLLKARQEQLRQEEERIASMTPDQVINLVLVYGVPSFPLPTAQAVGQWAAVYEGQGTWRIQGSVFTHITSTPRYWKTTWLYDGKTVKLIKYGL